MNSTEKLFKKISDDLEEINPENLFNSFEKTIAALQNSSDTFLYRFFNEEGSARYTHALDNIREALCQIAEIPNHLFKMLEYTSKVPITDFADVNFSKIQPIPCDFSFPGIFGCKYDQYKKLSARIIKTIYISLNQWYTNRRIFAEALYINYNDYYHMNKFMDIFSKINRVLNIREYLNETLKTNNIQIE